MNVLLGVTGSVAALLKLKLEGQLRSAGHTVKTVATNSAIYFLERIKTQDNNPVWNDWIDDRSEWPEKYEKDDEILHIKLREWAQVLVIAPLSANTLAKMANGLADNLLTCVIRAWDRKKPIIICPAMNTHMWEHPATAEHLETLTRWYNPCIIPPTSKKLACGDIGVGAMANIDDIVSCVNRMQEVKNEL